MLPQCNVVLQTNMQNNLPCISRILVCFAGCDEVCVAYNQPGYYRSPVSAETSAHVREVSERSPRKSGTCAGEQLRIPQKSTLCGLRRRVTVEPNIVFDRQ